MFFVCRFYRMLMRSESLLLVLLLIFPTFSGCLGVFSGEMESGDLIVSPAVLIGGEIQNVKFSVERDLAVFVPHLIVDNAGLVQNGTVLDLKKGETQNLNILAPPRINKAYFFIGEWERTNWPIRDSSESWNQWVARGGVKDSSANGVEKIESANGLSMLNGSLNNGGEVVAVMIPVERKMHETYGKDQGGLYSTGVVNGRIVYDHLVDITDESPCISVDLACGQLNRWAGQGNFGYEEAGLWLVGELGNYNLDEVITHRYEFTDIFENQNSESYNICGYKYGTVYPNEWLVFGAHFDIAPPANAAFIPIISDPHETGERSYGTRVGAYDNTAGSSMVLAVAEAASNFQTRRTMVFCFWSGEEGGKRGSDYWTDHYVKENNPDVTVTNYVNLDMAGVNWPGGGGAPCGGEHGGGVGDCDPDPQPDYDGYPKDNETWPLRLYIGPSNDYDMINQPEMVRLTEWVGADAINVAMHQDILVGNASCEPIEETCEDEWKYHSWIEQGRPEIITYEDTTARSDHDSFQTNLGTITLGYGGLVDGYWCYHQVCDTLEEMEDWMETESKGYGKNASGMENLMDSLDIITWWAFYMFFHLDEKPVLNTYLE